MKIFKHGFWFDLGMEQGRQDICSHLQECDMSWESLVSQRWEEVFLDGVSKGCFMKEEASHLEFSQGPQNHTL